MKRRLQTLAAVWWLFSAPPLGWLFFLTTAYLISMIPVIGLPFVMMYSLWVVLIDDRPKRGGDIKPSVRKWKVWEYLRDYFPADLVKTADLDPKKKYVFGYHPHGILSVGAFVNFGTEATGFSEKFPGINFRCLTLSLNFIWPFYRDYLLSFGTGDVCAESCRYNLKQGTSIFIVVGGAAESLDTHPNSVNLTLYKRKGFVRLALQEGACLVPIFGFGENNLYNTLQNPPGSVLRKFQEKMLKALGYAVPIFHGSGVFSENMGLLPHRRELVSVVGRPLELPLIPSPSNSQIDFWHSQYVHQLTLLYDEFKDLYDKDRVCDMKIVC